MATIIEEGRICVDCTMILANGEDSCEDECQHGAGLPIGAVLSGDTEEDDSEFYVPWQPCRGCGTMLAGTWFHYAILA